ncbi:hypothetical protein [Mycolicibacter heraklionensis]|uniref:hypothetical protein n=1 Tax=Mycolicibacter heraklionensis TaxID=512402 RepID=UPI000AABB9BB|nr:hypothetical protein [Mycolicibacter heraklionensis]
MTHASGALLGAFLLVIPPVGGPNVEYRAVALTAAEHSIDLVSPVDAVANSLGAESVSPLAAVIEDLTSDDGALNWVLSAEPALADPLGDFGDFIANLLTDILLGGFFVFGGLVVSVGQFFETAWDWIAGLFGFDPYVYSAEASGTGDITALVEDLNPVLDPGASGIEDIGALVDSLIS